MDADPMKRDNDPEDKFGLKRHHAIAASGIRRIFTPSKPIEDIELFMGREKEVESLIDYIHMPGQHALLFGDRGVGKSSLANIATSLLLKKMFERVFTKRCGSADTLESILREPFAACNFTVNLAEKKETVAEKGNAGIHAGFAKAGVESTRTTETRFVSNHAPINASTAAEILAGINALIVVDEFDRIKQDEAEKFAELMKLLSDMGSNCKFLLVGIAHNKSELVGHHPSVQRCLKETKLAPMDDIEIRRIIDTGERKSKMTFSNLAKDLIVRVSSGYPHFTQLLCLKSAELAIGNGTSRVGLEDLQAALKAASLEAEESLRTQYESAVRSSDKGLHKMVLIAAAKLPPGEIEFETLRRMLIRLTDSTDIQKSQFSKLLRRFTSNGTETIFRRLARGVYAFNDPRMPCYIRIANAEQFKETFR
jgi:hypothetical protein